MELPLEEWLENSDFPEEVHVAFREAAKCFKASAHRSALLFSYIGWNLAIRHRILSAHRPPKIPEKKWDQIADSLRDDDKWDAQAFDATQMKLPAPIFPVPDDLRTQVRYWKDRRNDCAHFKINHISSSHVEAFWSFLQSNLARFVPAGSEADLLQRLVRHYDPNFTAPGTGVTSLIASVPLAVDATRYPQFLKDVVTKFSYKADKTTYLRTDDLSEAFAALLKSVDSKLADASVEICTKEPLILTDVLRREPSMCLRWAKEPVIIRRLWRELLFADGHQDLPVFAALLRNALIPANEIGEATAWIARQLRGDIPRPEDFAALSQVGFFDAFEELAFADFKVNEFNWGNRNAASIKWFVENFPMNEIVTNAICSTFSAQPYPYAVRNALKRLLSSNPAKLAEFKAAAEATSRTVPADLVGEDEDDDLSL